MNITDAQKRKLVKFALPLFVVSIAIAKWPVAILFGALSATSVLLVCYGRFFESKLDSLKKDVTQVVRLPDGHYAIPVKVIEASEPKLIDKLKHPMRRWIVECIYPELESTALLLTQRSCPVVKVKLGTQKQKETASYQQTLRMSRAVKAIRDTQPKIETLRQGLAKSKRDEQLGLSSPVYVPRSKTIVLREIRQLEKSTKALEDIQERCREFIRNVLIGERLSKYEDLNRADNLTAQTELQQAKYDANIGERSQRMAEEEEALIKLIEETSTQLD